MPTKTLRVVLKEPLYEELSLWAKREGISLSLKVRDLIKESLEIEEDRALVHIAEKREQSFDRKKALTHQQVWSHVSRPRR